MALIDHLYACNRWKSARFVPLFHAGCRIGFVRRDRLDVLRRTATFLAVSEDRVEIARFAGEPARLTEAFRALAERLAADGLIAGLRSEPFDVAEHWGGPVLFELDRGAIPFFGTRSYGVHLNGWRPGADGIDLWIGRRALDKKIAPGKLDNLVAGGISAGYDARATLVKEAAEEADIPAALIAAARPAGAIIYRMELPDGMRDDVLFVYDLAVPAGFLPRNTDGEISDFRLMDARAALDLVRGGDDFKFNVTLVLIDFAIRHGLIGPEEPGYLSLISGLAGGLIGQDRDPGA